MKTFVIKRKQLRDEENNPHDAFFSVEADGEQIFKTNSYAELYRLADAIIEFLPEHPLKYINNARKEAEYESR